MNQISTHDRKIAETLKSLTLEQAPASLKPQRRYARPFVIATGTALLLALTGLTATIGPDVMARLGKVPAQAATVEPPTIVLQQPEAVQPQAPIPPAQPVPATREIAGSGYVVAPQSTKVFAKYGGTLEDVAIELGDRVIAGQVVLRLADVNARLALEQAQAAKLSAALALKAAQTAQEQALTAQKRIAALVARKVVPELQLEEANNAVQIAQNAVAQARHGVVLADLAMRVAREPVAALLVRAPIAGVVTQLAAHKGDSVLGRDDSYGDPLLTITNTEALVIDADIAETNIAALKLGQSGEAVLDGFPDAPFAIELARIAPVVSAAKGTVSIRLTLNRPPKGIRPNMAARIRIISTPSIPYKEASK